MKLDRRTSLLGACVVAAALAVPAVALAGNELSVRTAKHPDGPYAEVTALKILDGESKNGYVRVRNRLDNQVGVTFNYALAVFSGPPYAIKWFKGKENITADMGDDGYDFGLKPGKSKVFRMRIKAPEGAEPLCISAYTDIGGEFAGGGFFAVPNKNACPS